VLLSERGNPKGALMPFALPIARGFFLTRIETRAAPNFATGMT
jgi:hypothetical protein